MARDPLSRPVDQVASVRRQSEPVRANPSLSPCPGPSRTMPIEVRFALRADDPSVTCEVSRTTSHPTEADAHHFRIVAVMAT